MKALSAIALLMFCCNEIAAQFAKIEDRDGYVFVREKADPKSKIVGKIKSNEIVYISDKGNDNEKWSIVNYEQTKAGVFPKQLSGFVHQSRLKKISSFRDIPSVDSSEKTVHFVCCGVEVEIRSKSLDYEKNKAFFKKEKGYYTFKGQYAFGVWGHFPSLSGYKFIRGSVGKNGFEIPIKDIENLFSINNELAECYYDEASDTLYIILNNADGSEFYSALLVIEKGKYRRIITDDDH